MSEFVHMELNTSDTSVAKAFYKSVFGWEYQDVPMPNGQTYTVAAGAGGRFGGIQTNPVPGTPSNWLAYIGVESLQSTIEKAIAAGGQLVAHQEVPGMGTLAVFIDPTGATVAAWEALPAAKAPEKVAKKADKKAVKKAAKKAVKKAAKKADKKPEKSANKPANKAMKKGPKKG